MGRSMRTDMVTQTCGGWRPKVCVRETAKKEAAGALMRRPKSPELDM